jgi:hypothetical protein
MMQCRLLLSSVLVACARATPHANALLAAAPNPLDVASGGVPDVDREDLELIHFSINFTLPNTTRPCREKRVDCSHGDLSFHMQGYMPKHEPGSTFPAYLFVSGAGPWTNEIR